MDAPSWLVPLACTRCGAPGKFVDAQLIAICAYCGHIISAHRVLAAGHENLVFAEIRSFVIPTLADVRRLELSDLKHETTDPAVMHAATLELAALDAIEAGMSPGEIATWARWSAAIEQVSRNVALFTPKVEDFKADPARWTELALERWTRSYRDCSSAPAFPIELANAIPPEVAAMDALLGVLKAWVMFAPLAAFTTALVALGQRSLYIAGAPLPCRTCGAPITAESLAALACASCRSAIEVRRHLWLDGILRAVAMSNAGTLKQDERAAAACGMLTMAAKLPGNAPLPEHVIVAYLASLDGIERGALEAMAAFMLSYHSLGPVETETLHAIQRHLEEVPIAIPPPPGRRTGNFIALEPSEAWRRAASRNWKRLIRHATLQRDQRGLVAVNQLLPPLAGGYLPDPGDAAAFLRATGESLEQIRAAIALHASGEHDPDKRAFWDATAAALT